MAKIKTSELIDAQLDWLVAKCQGYVEQGVYGTPEFRDSEVYLRYCDAVLNSCYSPITDWAQAGPILEREITKIFRNVGGTWSAMILKDVPIPPEDRGTSLALTRRAQWNGAGPTPLIAAMRCFCSKLGDVVDIPEELCQQQNS